MGSGGGRDAGPEGGEHDGGNGGTSPGNGGASSGGAGGSDAGGNTSAGGSVTGGAPGNGGALGSGGVSSAGGAASGGAAPCEPDGSPAPAAGGGTGLPEPIVACVTDSAAGEHHTCMVDASGGVYCAGAGTAGQLGNGESESSQAPVAVTGLTSGARQVCGGNSHSCAVMQDGRLFCWGSNSHGELGNGTVASAATPVRVTTLGTNVESVSCGFEYTCAVTKDHRLSCWGRGDLGQLAEAAKVDRWSPVSVTALGTNVAGVSLSASFACARSLDGRLSCWGENGFGQLGDGTRTSRTTPQEITALGTTIAEVVTGPEHACARTTARRVHCWGNLVGSTPSDAADALSPVRLDALGTRATALSVQGYNGGCVALQDGAVWCWNADAWSDLRSGTALPLPTVRRVADLPTGPVALDTGQDHICARYADGRVYCWGVSGSGALARGYSGWVDTPSDVTALGAGVAHVAVGLSSTCAVAGGRLYCFGLLGQGQTSRVTSTPVEVVDAGGDVTQVALGSDHTCALHADGRVTCWGAGTRGQLGDGTGESSDSPVVPLGLDTGVAEISARAEMTCARTTDNRLFCFGNNDMGGLGDGTNEPRLSPYEHTTLGSNVAQVGVGGDTTCAVTLDRRLFCWGIRGGWRQPPTEITHPWLTGRALEVSVGETHTCARLTDSLWCFGDNNTGQLGGPFPDQMEGYPDGTVPTQWSPSLAQVAASYETTCAVTCDGRILCSDPSLGNTQGNDAPPFARIEALGRRVKRVAASYNHTCVITTDDRVRCWGSNQHGQAGVYQPARQPAPILQSCAP